MTELPAGFVLDAPAAPADLPPGFVLDTPSMGADVAKSAGIGLVKGGINLAGLPGDLMRTFDRLGDWTQRQMVEHGLISQEEAERQAKRYRETYGATAGDRNPIPGSQAIRRGVESVTGPFYEPQTPAGRYADTAAEFVPGAVMGPGGVVRNALRYGVAPGLAAEAAGQAVEGTGLERWARIAAALGVGGLGAVLTQPRTAERFIRAQLPEYVTDQAVNAADGLIRDAAARGITLTWPEALSQVTGRPVLNDVQRILEGSRQTRATMQEALGDRPAEIAGAARGEAANIAPGTAQPSTIGPAAGEAAEGVLNDVRGAINRFTAPYYGRAAAARLPPSEHALLRALPGYAEAAAAVRGDPQLARYVAGLPEDSVGFLNEVKKYLDQQATNAARPLAQSPNMQRAAGYGSDAAAARQIGVNASTDYATALAVQQHARETYLDPLLRGPLGRLADRDITTKRAIEALFPAEPVAGSADEISTAVSAIGRRNATVARQLVRAHIESQLDQAFNAVGRSPEAAQFAGAELAKRLTGSPIVETARGENFRAAIEALPGGAHVWPGVERFLEIARATGWRQPIGSKTAFNEAELHGMATGSALGNVAKTAASPGEWWHAAHELWGRWQTGNNLNALARIITDPRSRAVFERIVRMPQGQAVNAAARITFAVGVGENARDVTPAK